MNGLPLIEVASLFFLHLLLGLQYIGNYYNQTLYGAYICKKISY